MQGPFIGRLAETEAILAAVRHPTAAGAVVVGAPGMGKTSLLQHVQVVLADSHVVSVRGLPSAASFPFRALGFLISEVPAAEMHPALVVNAVAKHLMQAAAGRRIILAVDDAEHLDESSATLIGQLIARQMVSVILTVTDFAQADASFMAMWRTSALRRIDLPPLTAEETSLFVEARLAGPASREVVEAAWAVGGGNPQAMRGALLASTQRGVIARRGTSNVLLGGRPGTSEDLLAHFPVLQSLTAGQRAVVNLLALAGPLSWADLAHDTAPADVDALQDSGLLVIDSRAEPRASLATPGLSAAVAEVVSRQEAADLLRRIESVPTARERLHEDPARFVTWALRAGEPVDADRAAAAAAALNEDGEHERALQLVESIGMDASARLAYEALVAAVALGQLREAAVHAATLSASPERVDPRTWTLQKIEESRLQRLSTDSGTDAGEPLAEAEHRLAGWRADALDAGDDQLISECAALSRRLTLARAEVAAFEGRYRDALAVLDTMDVAGAPDTAETSRLLVARDALALEASIVMNRQSPAEALAGSLAEHLARPGITFSCADQALVRVAVAYLASGRANDGSFVLADFAEPSDRWSFRRGSLGALAQALLLLMQDQAADAATLLVPAVEQLRVADPHGILPVVSAVLSYCITLSQPLSQGAVRTSVPESDGGSGWLVRRGAEHYRLLASARRGNRGEAAQALQDRASSDLAVGADAWALVSLASAVRLGRQEAVVDLRDLAERLEGGLARTHALYASALLGSDATRLLDAMGSAAETGNLRLVADIAQSGINATTRNQDRAGLRVIQRRLRELVPEPAVADAAVTSLDFLTAREQQVAVLAAAGRSNRAIATQMFVSVRTVEGHLYQVYSKLQVNSRAELAALLPSESTA